MNVLSLFDGMSCGQIALNRAGIKYDNYFASEIDKYAIKITQKNYPNTIQLGDINNWREWKLPKIDLIIGGSPCQDLSIAKNNRKGLQGAKSSLFFSFLDILNNLNPEYFLLENVHSMTEYNKNIISNYLKCTSIMIDSSIVSAQQRKRLYWTNIKNIILPNDKNIFLKDIIETGFTDRIKSFCIDASYYKGANIEQYIIKNRRQQIFESVNKIDFIGGFESKRKKWLNNGKELSRNYSQGNRVYSVKGKSCSLNANGGGMGAKTGLYVIDLPDGDYIIRKLTPIECERLQTVPDNYTEGVSNTQRYKMLGNGWTVDVIVHIFNKLKEEMQKVA